MPAYAARCYRRGNQDVPHCPYASSCIDKTLFASQSEDQPTPCVDNDTLCNETACLHALATFAIEIKQTKQARLAERVLPLRMSYGFPNRKGTFPNVLVSTQLHVRLSITRKVAAKIRRNIDKSSKARLFRPLRVEGMVIHHQKHVACPVLSL
jgi:hypothetical protein